MAEFKIWMNGKMVPGEQAVLPVNSAVSGGGGPIAWWPWLAPGSTVTASSRRRTSTPRRSPTIWPTRTRLVSRTRVEVLVQHSKVASNDGSGTV